MPKTASQAPAEITKLVEQFALHCDDYRHSNYNETQLRRDYLDPFFAALGWDMDNRQGHAEAYREVVHEDSLRVEKSVRAPDSDTLRGWKSGNGTGIVKGWRANRGGRHTYQSGEDRDPKTREMGGWGS